MRALVDVLCEYNLIVLSSIVHDNSSLYRCTCVSWSSERACMYPLKIVTPVKLCRMAVGETAGARVVRIKERALLGGSGPAWARCTMFISVQPSKKKRSNIR